MRVFISRLVDFRVSGGRFLGSLLEVLVKWAGSLAR